MARLVRITALVDDIAGPEGTQAEHGLALWIETDSQRVLFDTGQGGVLWSNARALGARLERSDAIVLSHGHYDHTGGLDSVLNPAPGARVYAHPAAKAALQAAFPHECLPYVTGTCLEFEILSPRSSAGAGNTTSVGSVPV